MNFVVRRYDFGIHRFILFRLQLPRDGEIIHVDYDGIGRLWVRSSPGVLITTTRHFILVDDREHEVICEGGAEYLGSIKIETIRADRMSKSEWLHLFEEHVS